MVGKRTRAAIVKVDRAIVRIIDDPDFTTSDPTAVAALLGSARRLIEEVEA